MAEEYEVEDFEEPKAPIKTELEKILDEGIEDLIPEYYKRIFFLVLAKSTELSNLDDKDIKSILNRFDIISDYYLMAKRREDYSFDDEIIINTLRALLKLRLKRAKGGFERRMLASSISIWAVKESG